MNSFPVDIFFQFDEGQVGRLYNLEGRSSIAKLETRHFVNLLELR